MRGKKLALAHGAPETGIVRTHAAAASLDEIFTQADFHRRLFTLRAANPELAYELDELARAFRRVRDRVTAVLAEDVPSPPSLDTTTDANR